MTLRMVSLVSTTPEARPWRKRAIDPVERRDELAVALEIVLVILDVAERRRAAPRGEHRIEGVEAGEMVDRPHRGQREQIRLEVAKIVAPLIFEHVVGDSVGRH